MDRPKGDPARTYSDAEKRVHWDWGTCKRCGTDKQPSWMDVTHLGAPERRWLVNGFTCNGDCIQTL